MLLYFPYPNMHNQWSPLVEIQCFYFFKNGHKCRAHSYASSISLTVPPARLSTMGSRLEPSAALPLVSRTPCLLTSGILTQFQFLRLISKPTYLDGVWPVISVFCSAANYAVVCCLNCVLYFNCCTATLSAMKGA